ncbi:CvpA family protein [Candidatus Cyrtobacter comes]|nr:CvpA family protein [Candidatus Cyrtobacter comes]
MPSLDIGSNPLNGVDIALISFIVLSIIFGIVRGFWASLLSTTGWIFTLVITYIFGADIKPSLDVYIKSEVISLAASYCIIFTLALMGFAIVNSIILTILAPIRGGIFDKTFGIVFGVARGFLFVLVSFSLLDTMLCVLSGNKDNVDLYTPELIREAKFYPLIRNAINSDILPSIVIIDLQNTVDTISGTTTDDRFISSITKKLSAVFTKNEKEFITERVNSKADISTSLQDLEKIRVIELLKEYRKKLADHRAPDDIISSSDMERIEEIIKKYRE